MADPYAPRAETHTGTAPPGPPPWLEVVEERGGATVASVAELAALDRGEARFVAVVYRGAGLLPLLARLRPEQAVALAITHSQVSGAQAAEAPVSGESAADAAEANDALQLLSRSGIELYALKHGWVAGPEDRPGAVAVSAELVAVLLDAAERDQISWEVDPDFGYEVAARVPGVNGPEALALTPRLLYTAVGRVYEHAALVPAIRMERRSVLEAIEGLDPTIVGALD